jgi:hypothetical protein
MGATGSPSVQGGRISDSLSFWGAGYVLGLFLFAASAPSPLYGIYAARWHFSPLTLTIVFAIYAFGLLAALQVTGRLSDFVGRKPVILGAIALEIVAMLCFILADSTVVLAIARAVQGLATGCVVGAISAMLVEFSESVADGLAPMVSSAAPTFGLAIGGITSSVLVQYGPAPLRLIYWVIIAGLLLGGLLVAAMREPRQSRPGALASLKPVASLDPAARSTFIRVASPLIALWALIGFYLSLAPTLIGSIEHSTNLLWGGAVVFCLNFVGATAVVIWRRLEARSAMLIGCVALFVGVGITFVAIAVGDAVIFIIGSVIAGAGFGLAFLGAFRAVSAVATPDRRAGTLAVLYVVAYLAFSIPIILAGVAETQFSAHDVALVFSASVAVLSAVGVLTTAPRRHRT